MLVRNSQAYVLSDCRKSNRRALVIGAHKPQHGSETQVRTHGNTRHMLADPAERCRTKSIQVNRLGAGLEMEKRMPQWPYCRARCCLSTSPFARSGFIESLPNAAMAQVDTAPRAATCVSNRPVSIYTQSNKVIRKRGGMSLHGLFPPI